MYALTDSRLKPAASSTGTIKLSKYADKFSPQSGTSIVYVPFSSVRDILLIRILNAFLALSGFGVEGVAVNVVATVGAFDEWVVVGHSPSPISAAPSALSTALINLTASLAAASGV